jgi:hypothetical protein
MSEPLYPGVNASRERLARAGWFPEEEGWSFPGGRPSYRVVVGDGRRSVCGEGASAEAAWWRAAEKPLGGPGEG